MRIGFIGLGNMGGPMAINLVKAGGNSVVVFDVRRQAAAPHLESGAKWSESPQEVAAQSEVVMTSLPGPPEVEQVMFGERGIIHGIRPGAVYVDLSTNSPRLMRRIDQALRQKGVDTLDAPVSGGAVGAKAANLAIMVGGQESVFGKVAPVLELIGAKEQIVHVGAIGAGNIAKLAHNQLCMVTSAAIAEVFTMATKAGIAPEALYKVISDGAFGRGMLLKGLPAVVFKGDFDDRQRSLSSWRARTWGSRLKSAASSRFRCRWRPWRNKTSLKRYRAASEKRTALRRSPYRKKEPGKSPQPLTPLASSGHAPGSNFGFRCRHDQKQRSISR